MLKEGKNAGDEARKRGIHSILKPRADVTRNLKQGYQWPQKRTDVIQTFYK